MKKILALLLVILMTVSVLTACGEEENSSRKRSSSSRSDADANETVTSFKGDDDPAIGEGGIESNAILTVWCSDKAKDVTQELCDAFTSEHADKSITIHIEIASESDAATRVVSNPGEAADVFSFASDQVSKLLAKDALVPVTDVEDAFTVDEIKMRNSAESVSTATDGSGTLYAFPETADNGYYLVYDKSVISDEDARTLEGILAACRKAGRFFVMDAGNGFYSCSFLFTGGLATYGLDGDKQKFNDYDEDEVVDTLKAFSDLFYEYKDVFLSSQDTRICSGMSESPRTVAAGIDGSWNCMSVMSALGDDYGAAKLPTIKVNGENKQMISMLGYKYIGVNSRTRYPNAALALADYLTNEDSQIKRAEVLGWGPSNIAAMGNSAVSDNPAQRAIFAQAAYSVPLKDISPAFWGPMSTLGNYIVKQNQSRNDIKDKFEDTIDSMVNP